MLGVLVGVRACVQFVPAHSSQPLSAGEGMNPEMLSCPPKWQSCDLNLHPSLVALNHNVTSPLPPWVCVHPHLWALVLQTRVWFCSWAFTVLVTSGLNSSGTLLVSMPWVPPAGPWGHRRREGRQRTVASHHLTLHPPQVVFRQHC